MDTIDQRSLHELKDYIDNRLKNSRYEVPENQFKQVRATMFALADYYKGTELATDVNQFLEWRRLEYDILNSLYLRLLKMIENYK